MDSHLVSVEKRRVFLYRCEHCNAPFTQPRDQYACEDAHEAAEAAAAVRDAHALAA